MRAELFTVSRTHLSTDRTVLIMRARCRVLHAGGCWERSMEKFDLPPNGQFCIAVEERMTKDRQRFMK